MGKLNGCLKCIFVFFNVLFAVIGCVLIYGALQAAVYQDQMAAAGLPGNAWSWVFAFGVLLVSIFGVVAGCMEKELLLKVFAGLMVAGMLIMMIFGIIIAAYRNKIKNGFESTSSMVVDTFMEEEAFQSLLDGIQREIHCCGMRSYSDWGQSIPESCKCTENGNGGCINKPQGVDGPFRINEVSCGGIIFAIFDVFFKLAMGIFFGFAVLALLGLLVSGLMIWQMRRDDGGTIGQSIAMKG